MVEKVRSLRTHERVDFIAGDFFKDDLGKNYDVVFSSCNPAGKKREMVGKIRNCLRVGGLYVNKQFFWEGDEPDILDLEWNLWHFGIEKGVKRFTFKGDLTLEEYVEELEKQHFETLGIHEYGGQKMIVGRKTK